jgi:hypothetical protein
MKHGDVNDSRHCAEPYEDQIPAGADLPSGAHLGENSNGTFKGSVDGSNAAGNLAGIRTVNFVLKSSSQGVSIILKGLQVRYHDTVKTRGS